MKPQNNDKQLLHDFFANHFVFRYARQNKRLFQELVATASLSKLARFDIVYQEGEKSTHIYLIQYGEIHITHKARTEEEDKLIGILHDGDLFGEASLLNKGYHDFRAIAVLDSSIVTIPEHFFLRLLSEQPKVSSYIAKLLSNRFQQNLTIQKKMTAAQVCTFFYPELPRRGSELCTRLAQCLTENKSSKVLLITLNKNSILQQKKSKISLTEFLEHWPTTKSALLAETMLTFLNFNILTGTDIYDLNDKASEALAQKVFALLGHLRKYYSSILVDVGGHTTNPILDVILSQCDDIVLTRNANTNKNDKREQELWNIIITYAEIA